MGLREAIVATVIMGLPAVAAAEAKKPAKAPAKNAKKAAEEAKPAEKPDPTDAAKPDPDAEEADDAAAKMPPHIVGPKHVELGSQASIDLPEGMVLFEKEVTQRILRESGDSPEGSVAMVFKPGSKWRAFIDYEDAGYIDDSDADDLDAKELLESYRSGNTEQNKTRKSMGQPELTIDSWTEDPHYERAAHHLVWGLGAHDDNGKVINFITRILGRNGFLSVDLVGSPEGLEAAKKEALPVLQATHFNAGATYADHASSDRSSGIGLRGLVLGGAGVAVASKLGLFAKLLLVFKKGIILLVAGIAALFRGVFRRKKATPDPVTQAGDGSGWPPSGNPPDGSGQA